jgi:hypothetical protein
MHDVRAGAETAHSLPPLAAESRAPAPAAMAARAHRRATPNGVARERPSASARTRSALLRGHVGLRPTEPQADKLVENIVRIKSPRDRVRHAAV